MILYHSCSEMTMQWFQIIPTSGKLNRLFSILLFHSSIISFFISSLSHQIPFFFYLSFRDWVFRKCVSELTYLVIQYYQRTWTVSIASLADNVGIDFDLTLRITFSVYSWPKFFLKKIKVRLLLGQHSSNSCPIRILKEHCSISHLCLSGWDPCISLFQNFIILLLKLL